MRKLLLGTACAVLLAGPAAFGEEAPGAAVAPAASMPQSFAPLVSRVKPAVVNISTTELGNAVDRSQLPHFPHFPPGSPFHDFFREFGQPTPGQPSDRPLTALGSGFIIDPSGYIVTNNHVVRNGTKIDVTLQDGTTLKAKLVGHDELTDLAVLKVSADHPLPSVTFGNSDVLQVGDWVVSVGNPFGLGGTVTAGILSARGRDIHEGPYDDFLQIDAPINQGNSGGPTFNAAGQVVGINTAIFSPNGGGSVGIGFAIPSNIANSVVAELEKSGKVVRGWLGVTVQAIRPDMEDALAVKSTDGAVVASVSADSPAARAGIEPGDVITRYGNEPIRRLRDVTWAVANTPPGKAVTLTVVRGGKETVQAVTIGTLPSRGAEAASNDQDHQLRLGLALQPITPETAAQFDLPRNAHGVVVAGVSSGSPADEAGLQPGDIIERVNHAPVSSPQQLVGLLKTATTQGKKSVALNVVRDGRQEFVAIALPHPDQS